MVINSEVNMVQYLIDKLSKVKKPDLKKSLDTWIKSGSQVACLNPHSLVLAHKSERVYQALKNSDILLCDGIGTFIAAKILRIKYIQRITGFEIFENSLSLIKRDNLKLYMVGGTSIKLKSAAKKLENIGINQESIKYYAPPFSEIFIDEEVERIREMIVQFNPDIVFLFLGAPKQEMLMKDLNLQGITCVLSIGAVLDFYINENNRAPKLLRELGLEFMFRLSREPKKIIPRIFISGPLFILLVGKAKLNIYFNRR